MNKIKTLMIVLVATCATLPVFSQGFTPPADGNAAIYFVRVSDYGALVSFEYFHQQEFIGIFKGKNYMRFEYPAGEHLFWASSEDKEFLKCDLKAGETYVVLVNIEMGAWKARIGLEPVLVTNDDFDRVKKVIQSKAPIVTPEAKLKSTQKSLDERGFTKEMMERYETEWKNAKNTKTISQDMFIPKEKLQ
jgi:hypothetical protein